MHERLSFHPEPSLLPFKFSTQVLLGMLSFSYSVYCCFKGKCDCYFHLDPAFLPDKLIHVTGSKSDLPIMLPRHLNLAKHIPHPLSLPIRININIRPRHVNQRHHLLDPLRHLQRVRLPRRLEGISPLLSPPVMFKVMPSSLQRGSMDGACMLIATEDA
jgi:hypothetical protein